ncbi:hypothetical protein, variant [Saprolegnia diclina VS20]|nr:hypothetical protein, variant [Saprolegnia diclina VS20]EQC32980.1 hypothetical protein, variant [Saprolegnia diclina VS20]|eukprot:XP_008613666.1 hypothetical protein, variant [Saprolegnia diclina VS20]
MLCTTSRAIATGPPQQPRWLSTIQLGARQRTQWQRAIDVYGNPYWRCDSAQAADGCYVVSTKDGISYTLQPLTDASARISQYGEHIPSWWFPRCQEIASWTFHLKYAWLHSQIHNLLHGYAQVRVYRDRIFEESIPLLLLMTAKHLCAATRVMMLGESGVDAGGIQREWYTVLTTAVFDPAKGLFVLATDFAYALNPTSATAYGPDHLLCYRAIGRLLGRAVLDGQVLPCRLALPLFKAILGTPLSLQDVRYLDTQTYSSLQYLLEHDVSELGLDFSAAMPATLEVVDLVPNGRQIAVTNDNKASYVDCMVRYLLFDRVAVQLTSLLKGVYEVLPQELLMPFDYKELELVLCGVAEVDVADWKASTSVSTTLRRSESLNWFWDVLEHDMSRDDRSKLLQFTTGSSRVPVQGFRGLTSYDGTLCPFSLQAVAYSVGVLPKAHSCFNRLDLPLYPTRALMHEALFALTRLESAAFTLV